MNVKNIHISLADYQYLAKINDVWIPKQTMITYEEDI